MTVSRLHKLLGDLINSGSGRLPVAIDKRSFKHNLEPDGLVIMDVTQVEGPILIRQIDGDGWTKINKDGSESQRTMVILRGD